MLISVDVSKRIRIVEEDLLKSQSVPSMTGVRSRAVLMGDSRHRLAGKNRWMPNSQ